MRALGSLAAAIAATAFAGACSGPRPEPARWPSSRTLSFSGLEWHVRAAGTGGPGPNLWSDAGESVRIDEEGRLRLRLRADGLTWHAAEVWTVLPEGRARVEVHLDEVPPALPPEAVLGLFVYRDDRSELDVELGRFGDPAHPGAQFAVAPQLRPGNLHRFPLPVAPGPSVHVIEWGEEAVGFESRFPGGPPVRWRYEGPDVPEPGGHALHLNLWLAGGRAPAEEQGVEVVIGKVIVRPLP